jgi:hypothetical protein
MSDCFLIIAIPLANIKKAEKCQYDKIFVKLTFFKRPAPTLDELFKKKKIIHVSSNTLIHKKNIARAPVSKILKVRPTLMYIFIVNKVKNYLFLQFCQIYTKTL